MQREAWIQQLRDLAPFASNRVSSPNDARVNVDSIHRSAYENLMELAQEARRRPRGGCGVVLWGDPGVGKSHLLARFAKNIQDNEQGLFLLIHNLLVAPRLLPSSLLKCFIARLTAHPSANPAKSILYGLLYKLVVQTIKNHEGCLPDTVPPKRARELFLSHVVSTIRPALPQQAAPDCRRIAEVLFAYFEAAYRINRTNDDDPRQTRYRTVLATSEQWLSGEELERSQWELLGLSPSATADKEIPEPNDQLLETVILVLLEISHQAGLLVVMCFDQVENLSSDRFVELFRFNHALLDHGRNLLMVTSGVKTDLVALRKQGLAPEAAWDRIAAEHIELTFISIADAKQLLQARMHAAVASGLRIPELAEKIRRDDLFPLGEAWWQLRVNGLLEVRPRDVISWAHQRWREQCRSMETNWESFVCDASVVTPADPGSERPPAADCARWVDERIECKVREKVADTCNDPSKLPPDAGQLAGLLQVTLERISRKYGFQLVVPQRSRTGRRYYDVMIERNSGEMVNRVGIVVLPSGHATATTAAYRRIAQDTNPPHAVLVLRDIRMAGPLGAKGQEYRQHVRERHQSLFRDFEVELAEYAHLTALEAVIGDARSGDLEVELPDAGLQRVSEQEVEASYHRCGHYLTSHFIKILLELLQSSFPGLNEGQCEDNRSEPTLDSRPAARTDGKTPEPPHGNGVLSMRAVTNDLRSYILGELQLVPGISSRELAERLHRQGPMQPPVTLTELTRLLQDTAQQLHREKRLQATPTEDDLYLLLRP